MSYTFSTALHFVSRWLLIPAHCVVSVTNGPVAAHYLEVYHPLKSASVQYVGEISSEKIDKVIIHPKYNRSDEFSIYDFALLTLSTNKPPTKYRQSLNMPRLDRCSSYFNVSQCTPAITLYSNNNKSYDFSHGTIDRSNSKSLDCTNVKNVFCFQIHQKTLQNYLSEGSGVFAKTNEHYDIIGLVTSETRKQMKSASKPYIRTLSICHVTNWMKEVLKSNE